jgi:hypothetical protein
MTTLLPCLLLLPAALMAPCNECERKAAARAAEEASPADGDGAIPAIPATRESAALQSARAFVAAMGAENPEALLSLCADRFNFDGRVVTGRDEIERIFRWILSRHRPSLAGKQKIKIEILSWAQAQERFGPPPKKFAAAFPTGTLVAAVTFEKRPGFLLFATQVKNDWKIAGIAE